MHDIPNRKRDAEAQQKLFDALNRFIMRQGGFVVSPPGAKRLRVAVPQGSDLPSRLTELGYRPRHVGVNTRLAAIGQHGGFLPVDVLEISLG